MGLFKVKKVAITKPQAETVIDQLKIAEYNNFVAGKKSLLGTVAPPAPKSKKTEVEAVKAPEQTGTNTELPKHVETQTPVEARAQLAPKQTRSHGY